MQPLARPAVAGPSSGSRHCSSGWELCLVGKSIDGDGQSDGFVVKLVGSSCWHHFLDSEAVDVTWSHRFGQAGSMEVANSVAVTESGVFVVGVDGSEGLPATSLRKLSLSTGVLAWQAQFASNGESASECIHANADGSAVVGGLVDGEAGGLEGFKSYGNPISGTAAASYFSASQLAADSAPLQPEQQWIFPGLTSVRAIKPVADGGYVVLAAKDEEHYVVLRIDSQGQELWRSDSVIMAKPPILPC